MTHRTGVAAVAAVVVLLGLTLRTVITSLPPLLADIRDDLGLSATMAGLLTTLPVLVAVGQAALPTLIRLRWAPATGALMGAYPMALPLGATLAAAAAVPLKRALGGWEDSLAAWCAPAIPGDRGADHRCARVGHELAGPAIAPLRRDPLAWSVALYFGLQSAGFYAGLAWLAEILRADGYSEATAGGLFAICSVASVGPARSRSRCSPAACPTSGPSWWSWWRSLSPASRGCCLRAMARSGGWS